MYVTIKLNKESPVSEVMFVDFE